MLLFLQLRKKMKTFVAVGIKECENNLPPAKHDIVCDWGDL